MALRLPPPSEASKPMESLTKSSPQLPQDKVTIKQLKSLLRKKGLPVTGRKADLIQRLVEDRVYSRSKTKALAT